MATDPKSPRPFEDLLAETQWLGRLAAQLVPPADREDLVQDVLVSAMRTERPKHLRGWLRTVARNLAARRRSKEQNRRSREQTVARSESSEPSVADALEAFASHRAVVNAVMDLDEPYRTAVLLRFWEDLPPREVARRTGVPVETARTRIKRGVDRLRLMLDDRSGGRSAWVLPLLQIGGVREAFLASSATAGTTVAAGTTGTMALPILTGALAMKKAALATVAVASIVATVAIYTYGDGAVDEWPGTAGTPTQHAGTAKAAGVPAVTPANRTELEETASATPADRGLVVTVADRFGNPLEGANVWQWSDRDTEEVPAEGVAGHVTDDQGQVRLMSGTSAGGIVVLARDHVVVVRRLSSLSGEHQVQLEGGERVQGWIRVDGKEPGEPIPLRLGGNTSHRLLKEIPPNLREVVERFLRDNHRVVWTTAHGAFEFTGLSKGWRGSIRLPLFLWLRGECFKKSGSPRMFGVPRPQQRLQLDTTMLPGVRCRVVWDDTGEGVAKPIVSTLAVLPDGGETGAFGVWATDGNGYFRVGFGPQGSGHEARDWANANEREPLRQIKVWVTKEGSHQEVVVDPSKLEPPRFVEIRLKRAFRLHFLAVDPEGQPVPGAVLLGSRSSEPSDADGSGIVEVKDSGRRQFLAAAPGHVVDDVEARTGVGTAESPLEIVLPKGNKVVVTVKSADNSPPKDIYLSVRSNQPLFTGPDEGRPSRLHPVVGSRYRGGGWGHGKMDFHYPLSEAGEVGLGSLLPGVPFQLAVLDKVHQEVLVRDAVSPSAQEVKRIELRLTDKPQDFVGLVVDVHDRPIPRARATVSCQGYGHSRSTDRHGRFTFESVYPTGKPLKLALSRGGYVGIERKDVVITKGMAPVKVRLLKGHNVKITFVDPKGERVPVMWCAVEGDISGRYEYHRLEPGLLVLTDLPAGPQTLFVDIGGRTYERKHDAAASSIVRWEVPAMGHIQVQVPRPTHLEWNHIRAVITAQSDGKSFEEGFLRGASHEPTIATRQQLLLPGRYRVRVQTWNDGKVLHPARDVTVEPGKLARCRFGKQP